MKKPSKYVSKPIDENGLISWSKEENEIWHDLITRQYECIKGRACDEYLVGLDLINLPTDRVPQLEEINKCLNFLSGVKDKSIFK